MIQHDIFTDVGGGIQQAAGRRCQLGRDGVVWFVMVGSRGVDSGRCHCPPGREGARFARVGDWSISANGVLIEKDSGRHRGGRKTVGLGPKTKSAHLPFPLASWLRALVGICKRFDQPQEVTESDGYTGIPRLLQNQGGAFPPDQGGRGPEQ
jgi:hypothetical protein